MTVPVQPTRRRRPELLAALFLICGLGAWACSRAPGAGDSPEADGGVAVRPEPEPARPAPTRLRRWPQLERWLRGESIAYEFHAEPLLPSETLAARGQQLFALYCYQCHGREGRGDGPRAPMFDPPPRDLTRAKYKFRSTPPGEPPAREDLYRTITLGLRGTGMVPFADLPSSERWALVEYVRELSGFDENDVPAVEAPTVPADVDDPARIARGAKAYSRNGCAACHGSGGRGDGPAAGSLRDSLGNPLRPADFGLRPLKRGAAADQIYLTLRTGLDGTPMPAFSSTAADELWDVVAFVRQLSKTGARRVSAQEREEAKRLMADQQGQGRHAVVDGCGCQARRRAARGESAER